MEEFEYYTLFGVRLNTGNDMIPKFKVDYVLRWSTHEKENAKLIQHVISNELFKTTADEAFSMFEGMRDIAHNMHGIQMRVRFNPNISSHLFVTKEPLTDEWLDIMIDYANISDDGKKKLAEALVRL